MIKEKHPYLPVATFQQVINYIPGNAETYTASPIVNALAQALFQTQLIESKEIAEYLDVDARRLACAIQLDLGMKLIDVIQQYRINQVQQYTQEHPDATLTEVAHACGYASDDSLWRFFQRKLGTTVGGTKSNAGPEHYNLLRQELRKKRGAHPTK